MAFEDALQYHKTELTITLAAILIPNWTIIKWNLFLDVELRICNRNHARSVHWIRHEARPPAFCGMMDGIRFCRCGCGCQSEDPFVCFGTKPTQRACNYLLDQKRMREGRSQREQKKPGQLTDQDSRQNRVNRRGQSREENSSWGLWTQRPGWPTWKNESVFLVALWEFCSNSLTISHRCTESYTKVSQTFPFLHLELTQVCLFSFLPPSRLCMLCFVCL